MITKSDLIKKAGPLGLYSAIRYLTRNSPRIVMYHRFSERPEAGKVSADVFEKQIQYMVKHFDVQPLAAIVNRKGQGCSVNTLVLTVDDGHEDFYRVAYPVLKKYNLPCTLFVTTDFIEGGFWLWPDKISWLLNHYPVVRNDIVLGQKKLQAGPVTKENRSSIWDLVIGYLLTLSDTEKLSWIAKFSDALDIYIPENPPEEFKACSWPQLREMQHNGIAIGGHTVTHPSLGRVNDTQLSSELDNCKSALDQQLGVSYRDFCYPNGQPQDYNDKVKRAVQKAGFRSSVVAFYDKKSIDDIWAMRRYTVSADWFQFFKSVNGIEFLGSRLVNSHNRMHWKY